MHRGRTGREFSEGGNACRQMRRPVRSREELPAARTRELGGLEEGVGAEDGGDDLAGGVDSALAV